MCHKVVDRSWEFTVLRQEIPKRRLSVLRWGRLRRSSHADPTLNWDPGPAQGGSPGPRATPPTRPLPPGALSLGNSASGGGVGGGQDKCGWNRARPSETPEGKGPNSRARGWGGFHCCSGYEWQFLLGISERNRSRRYQSASQGD